MDTINEKNTVAEIKVLFEKASDDSLIELLKWEQSHKNRKTLVKFIDSKLKKPKNPKKTSYVYNRKTTLQYEVYRDHIRRVGDISQPKFDSEAENKKQEIWGYEKGYSAFSRNKCNSNRGDHIYGIREHLGKISTDTLWGKIPCTHGENISWKRYTKSDGSIGKLTDNVIDESALQPREQENLGKLRKWSEYCKQRNVTLAYDICPELEQEWSEIICQKLSEIDEACAAAGLRYAQTQIPVRENFN